MNQCPTDQWRELLQQVEYALSTHGQTCGGAPLVPETLKVSMIEQTDESGGHVRYVYHFTARDSTGTTVGIALANELRHPDERLLAEHVRAAMRRPGLRSAL